jgi:L-lactate dehydrogenase (cytochrome)
MPKSVPYGKFVHDNFDASTTWKDIEWIRSIFPGKIISKGILDPEDAKRAVQTNIDGILVSNHGGRQLDSVTSTIRALPRVVDAVQGKVPVFMDGGIRSGLDVLKALALGAKACFLARAGLGIRIGGGRRVRGTRHAGYPSGRAQGCNDSDRMQ